MTKKEDQEIRKKILLAQPFGSRRGRPRLHWTYEVDEDTRMFGVRDCWMMAQD